MCAHDFIDSRKIGLVQWMFRGMYLVSVCASLWMAYKCYLTGLIVLEYPLMLIGFLCITLASPLRICIRLNPAKYVRRQKSAIIMEALNRGSYSCSVINQAWRDVNVASHYAHYFSLASWIRRTRHDGIELVLGLHAGPFRSVFYRLLHEFTHACYCEWYRRRHGVDLWKVELYAPDQIDIPSIEETVCMQSDPLGPVSSRFCRLSNRAHRSFLDGAHKWHARVGFVLFLTIAFLSFYKIAGQFAGCFN